ncbi:MAG: hypothetical protein CME62_06830 [Halobacteriovoraceae bacterium]|nr:hypothetical protein [Halobacteriovoraceae bacterium]|tara:strand:+ start:2982 stop:3314 length:333 start_codon:yes stop_codon:yes gene_type:complete
MSKFFFFYIVLLSLNGLSATPHYFKNHYNESKRNIEKRIESIRMKLNVLEVNTFTNQESQFTNQRTHLISEISSKLDDIEKEIEKVRNSNHTHWDAELAEFEKTIAYELD